MEAVFISTCRWNNSKNANKNRKDKEIDIYKLTAAPVLMNGNASWTLNRSKRRTIERTEILFIKCVWAYEIS
jgi:hypothetical protein